MDANREIGDPGVGGPGSDWRSRGYLPHCESIEAIQHVTFHLADSLPKTVVERLDLELKMLPIKKRSIERRKRLEAWVDTGHGSCVLQQPAIAEMVQNTLLHFDWERYFLLAWAVMPNHVHALFERKEGWTVGKIVGSWKKFTARRICGYLREADRVSSGKRNLNGSGGAKDDANREIGGPGVGPGAPVWHREYWDRYMRNEDHLREMIEYIHQNPVKAGLVRYAEGWEWSSAYSRGSA